MTGVALRVAFTGSSSMESTAPLPARLAAELGLSAGEWIALGVRGSGLAHWGRPATWPSDLRPEAIVMLLPGANDGAPSAERVLAADRALRAHAPVVIWLPPFPYPEGSRVRGQGARMREALARAHVVRVEPPVRLASSDWAPDGVHLTRAGYRAYAEQVAPSLAQALALRAPSVPRPGAPPNTPAITAPSPAPAPAAWPSSVMGTLITGRGARLPLTSTDALWMARALTGEGGREPDALAITSTMLRRWALLWDANQRTFRTLTDLVVGRFRSATPYDGDAGEVALRGYSQPVAVQWRAQGSADARARRARIRSLAWDAIDPVRRQAILRLFTGRAALSAHAAVHFAERSVVERRLREHPDWQLVPVAGALNVFVSAPQSRALREPRVIGADQAPPPERAPGVTSTLPTQGSSASTALIAGAAAAAIAGALLLALHRSGGPDAALA